MSGLDRGFLSRPIAHRGLHGIGAVENSATAFERAIASDFGIELDVQASQDGVPMVFHDYTLDRLTSQSGLVKDRTAAELGQVALHGSEDGIATLAAVLDLVAGKVPLLIEIKDQDGALGPDVGSLSDAVADALEGYRGPVAVMSFNPAHVAGINGHSRGLVTCDFNAQDWSRVPLTRREELVRIPDTGDIDFISHQWTDLGRDRVAEAKAGGLAVLCWTIRSAEEAGTALRVADNITFEGYDPDG